MCMMRIRGRAACGLCGALIALSHASPANAQQTAGPKEQVDESFKTHFLGLRIDYGHGTVIYGAYYLHAWGGSSSSGGLGALGYAGVGFDLRVVQGERDTAIVLGPIARAGGITDAMGGATELGFALATDGHRALPVIFGGFFTGFYYADLGGSFLALPAENERPAWLPTWCASARVQLPLHTYDRNRSVTIVGTR